MKNIGLGVINIACGLVGKRLKIVSLVGARLESRTGRAELFNNCPSITSLVIMSEGASVLTLFKLGIRVDVKKIYLTYSYGLN